MPPAAPILGAHVRKSLEIAAVRPAFALGLRAATATIVPLVVGDASGQPIFGWRPRAGARMPPGPAGHRELLPRAGHAGGEDRRAGRGPGARLVGAGGAAAAARPGRAGARAHRARRRAADAQRPERAWTAARRALRDRRRPAARPDHGGRGAPTGARRGLELAARARSGAAKNRACAPGQSGTAGNLRAPA